MVLVTQGVVEIRGQMGFIALSARCCEELLAVSLQLQHQRLRILTDSDVDVHDFER